MRALSAVSLKSSPDRGRKWPEGLRLAGLALILCIGALAAAVPLAAQTRQLQVVQEKAPMFKEHSISSPIIKYLEKGSKINLLAAEDSFYLVSYGGFEGWVIPFSVRELAGDAGAAEATQPSAAPYAQGEEGTAEDEMPGRYVTVRGRYANVREGPGMEYNIVGKAYRGQKLEKFIKRGDWYRVRLPDSKIGFIREDLLAGAPGSGKSSRTGSTTAAAAAGAKSAPVSNAAGSVESRLAGLEEEMTELRALLLEHLKGPGGASASQAAPQAGAGQADQNTMQNQGNAAVQGSRAGRIIGNRSTKVYHLPTSIFYDKIPEEFRVYFNTEEDARKAGFTASIR